MSATLSVYAKFRIEWKKRLKEKSDWNSEQVPAAIFQIFKYKIRAANSKGSTINSFPQS